jgi:hypothetical protein
LNKPKVEGGIGGGGGVGGFHFFQRETTVLKPAGKMTARRAADCGSYELGS